MLELAYLHPEEDHKSVWLKRMLDSFTNLKWVFCMNLALRILEGLVLCACMYAAETWLVTKEMCQELNAFFKNQKPPVEYHVKQKTLKWFGHLQRM